MIFMQVWPLFRVKLRSLLFKMKDLLGFLMAFVMSILCLFILFNRYFNFRLRIRNSQAPSM